MSNVIRPLKENTSEKQVVGTLRQDIIDTLNLNLPSADIYMYPGAVRHIKKRHMDIFQNYFQFIPDIISDPDYAGINPTEPNSVELVKILGDNMLVAIKLDPSGYLYFSSIYQLKPRKLANRISSGRLKKISP